MSEAGKRGAPAAARRGGSGRRKGMSNRVAAMSHPLRARILHLLTVKGPMSPSDLVPQFAGDERLAKRDYYRLLSQISYHCQQLCKLDCAELVSTRPVRGTTEHFYRATDRPLIDTNEWDELDEVTAEDLLCGYIQEILDDFVASRSDEIVGSDADFHITRTPMVLDGEGLREGIAAYEDLRLEMNEVLRRSTERLADSKEAGVPVSSSLVYFKIPVDRVASSARGAAHSNQDRKPEGSAGG